MILGLPFRGESLRLIRLIIIPNAPHNPIQLPCKRVYNLYRTASIFVKVNVNLTFNLTLDFEFKKNQ
ncbi:hypothetical protein SULZ_03780 [Saccharolobus solfataricus]|uniref:Uncharacterized protein n=2 Tax=Saccharolobus solfataricus TaxID=2287 RepID=A0A3G8EP71_SACSO|nr:hypothetical protein SULZ_03780 [Saccharolobus solfataricus]